MTKQATELRAMDAADLYRAYAPFVARYVYRLGVPAAQVDDVVQEVFIVAHKRGGYVPGPAKPTSYLASIAVHAASHARRSTRRRDAHRADAAPDDQPELDAAPDRALEVLADVELVRSALSRLDPALAATLLLADGEDEPCGSIAAAMGVPVGTVYYRLHNARRKFSAAVQKLEAQRGHEVQRAREAPPLLTATYARRAIMLGIFGGSRRAFEKSRAFELLRSTRRADGGSFDAQAGLARHQSQVLGGADAPTWAAPDGSALLGRSGLAGSVSVVGKWGALLVVGGVLAGLVAVQRGGRRDQPRPLDAPTPLGALPLPAQPPAPDLEGPGAEPASASVDVAPTTAAREAASPALPTADAPRETRRPRRPRARASASSVSGSAGAAAAELAPAPLAQEAAPEPKPAEPPAAPASKPAQPAVRTVNPLTALASAERLASTRPDEALALLAQLEQSAASRYLAEELAFVRLSAHYHAGHRAQVRRAAPVFLAAHPTSAFAARVRAMADAVGR
jgi:RNA polymerase sigma-70 factor, ECF subfamily